MAMAEELYINKSLDDIIRAQKLKKVSVFRHPPSQQWRLGKNGSNWPMQRRPVQRRPMLKRLGRHGPLRPVGIFRSNNYPSTQKGLPRLVKKKLRYKPITSVFHRLGPNPTIVLARQRAIRARHLFWRRQRHPYYFFNRGVRRNLHYQRPWHQRPWHQQHWQRNHMPNFQPHISHKNDMLIKAERQRVAERVLLNTQRSYESGAYVGNQQILTQRPEEEYPIASDLYPSQVRPDRVPSPEGSIISSLPRLRNINPFGARPTNNGMGQSNQAAVNPFMADFRATPTTGQMTFDKRFAPPRWNNN